MPGRLPKGCLLHILLSFSCCAVTACSAERVQFGGLGSVQGQRGTLGVVVPLSTRHEVVRQQGRRLLKHGAITPVLGAVHEGYFYAQLMLGTPPKAYSTIIDTGSSITYIPCSKCRSCGKHMAAPFDPSKSSTARWVGCADQQCQCGTPACTCKQQTCYYIRHYAEESSSEGWMVADKLHLPAVVSGAENSSSSSSKQNSSSSRSVDVVFGCENVETGEIYKQRVDGVLGMGNNANSLPRQLARAGVIENVFALCYGFPEGGSMLLGDVPTQPSAQLVFTPFVKTSHHYYTIATVGISLGGKALPVDPADFSKGYGTVLDSGTTFTYLPSSAYRAFHTALLQALKGTNLRPAKGSDPSYTDVCWEGAPHDWDALNKVFPSGNLTFAGGAFIELVPYRYLFLMSEGQYCLGVFDNGSQGTLLGGIITRNVLVQYDKEKNRAGFAHVDCNSIKAASQGADASPGGGADAVDQQPGAPQQPAPKTAASSTGSSSGDGTAAADSKSGRDASGATAGQQAPAPDHRSQSADRKLLLLGVAVGAVLLIALVQLAFATLWQPPPGSSKGSGSSGGLLPAAFGGQHRSYQQVGTSDDQELVEFSEHAVLVRPGPQQASSTAGPGP